MANRNFNRAQNLEKEIKSLFAEIAIGPAGAPTLTRGTGIASVTRASTGLYTVVLQDQYNRLMFVGATFLASGAESISAQLVSSSVTTAAKSLVFRTVSTGVATDPANGDTLFLRLDLKNSSVR